MLLFSGKELRELTRTDTAGGRALLTLLFLVFVAVLAYELALLGYQPKERPLQFHSSVSIPYYPFLLAWSMLLILAGASLLYHRRLHALLGRFGVVKRYWSSLLLMAIAMVAALFAAELLLRLFDPMGISTFPRTLHFWEVMIVPDEELRYRLRANVNEVFDGIPFRTNSEGMRDDEPLPNKPGRRILVLGDSVALGSSVPRPKTMFPLLEERLGGRSVVDVVNTAVPSYNTVQHKRLLFDIGDRYDPDLVLLLYVENDAKMEHDLPFYPAEYWQQPAYLPRRIAQYTYSRHLVRLGLGAINRRASRPISPAEKAGWKVSRAALVDINDWCRSRGIPFLVVFYPMLDPATGQHFFEILSAAGEADGIPVVDSRDFWKDRPLSDIHLAPVDSHLNVLGHDLMAAGLEAELRRRYPRLFQ